MPVHASRPLKPTRASSSFKPISRRQLLEHAKEASVYYSRIRARLYKNPAYRDKYVVIRDRKIVEVMEANADKFILQELLLKKFPDHKFLVMPVWSEFPAVDIGS
jgi:hypothetical protein